MENQSNADSNKENVSPTWIPQLGMTFSTLEEVWKFWGYYGGRKGFSIRQRYKNKSKFDGKFTSCKYVCSKEGLKSVDKRDNMVKNPRAETRTEFLVRMTLSINREAGNWAISDLFLEHNHIFQLPEACHLLPSQRMISEVQALEIEIADDSGIAPKVAHEFASRRVGGPSNLSYTRRDHKNHLRTKRQRDLKYGEAGSMLKYFQDKATENPSFKYDLQLDCDEKIANIFWVDAKMIIDYAHFGDVMTFDTTFPRSTTWIVYFSHYAKCCQTSCGCGQFERLGALCAHALKVFDLMNITLLPEHYILKRWTREARAGLVQDSHGRIVVGDPKLDAVHRTNFLSHKFYNLVTEASNSEKCCILIENTLDNLSKEVKGLLNAQVTIPASNILLNAQVTTPTSNDTLAAACLKKKEVNKEDKSSKRKKSWTERQYKGKKIGPTTTTTPLSKGKKRGKKDLKTKESYSTEQTLQEDLHGYDHITNFTELLNMPSSEPSIGEDIF